MRDAFYDVPVLNQARLDEFGLTNIHLLARCNRHIRLALFARIGLPSCRRRLRRYNPTGLICNDFTNAKPFDELGDKARPSWFGLLISCRRHKSLASDRPINERHPREFLQYAERIRNRPVNQQSSNTTLVDFPCEMRNRKFSA